LLSFNQSISPIRIIFITSVIILAALSVFSYKKNLDLVTKANLVNHTNVVKFELQNAVSILKDAETGARGYYLTGTKEYLGPYFTSQTELPATLKTLDSLLADNPIQIKNMQRLRILSDEKNGFLKKMLALPAFGKKDTDLLATGRVEIEEIGAHIKRMLREEESLLTKRTATLNEAVSFAPMMNVLLAGFAILLLIFSYFKILRELEKSNSLQEELKASNEVLEKSNNELAQFAYVASHDLQEPLRKIQTFISRIQVTEPGISAKGKDYFARINNSAKRMQQLIRDILSYSRVDSADKKFERTDLNSVVNAAKEQLEEFIKEQHATINSSSLPSVNVVRYQFEQLFLNLISNALKFARPDTPGIINISATIIKGTLVDHPAANKEISYHCISVADNGIGFEQQYGERIFKIFHRLNTKEDYSGNGIGLSIVKKIMETHRGFITATGVPGQGAVFSVYLPA
jgi:signal transduction histidine kinase